MVINCLNLTLYSWHRFMTSQPTQGVLNLIHVLANNLCKFGVLPIWNLVVTWHERNIKWISAFEVYLYGFHSSKLI